MTWTALTDKTTGTLITAAHWNLMMGVTGNLAESAPAKVTTAGDMLVATGANALARLAAVATGQVLTSQGVGVAPAWAVPAAPPIANSSAESVLGSDVLMDVGTTWTNTGLTLSLAAGEWFLMAHIALLSTWYRSRCRFER